MIEIPLTRGYTAIIDNEDADLNNLRWFASNSGHDSYAYYTRHINGKSVKFAMHRIVVERMTGQPIPPRMVVDHINHNTLDNRRSNLRLVTYSENLLNRRRLETNTSGTTGVYWRSDRQKWYAQISTDKITIRLGSFDKIEDAIAAREKAFAEYVGHLLT